ncbi:uncharacterized protein E0L32_003728 [Thyridium curvatum]|uniref:Threonylcarbamoyl-AMP synthase n=1 Tax=Thyridium curvatum TaxID=1093900 RepID=A0A507BCP0_9PEZI|nr:uncharacterized protein E0L32_003728 [Thyridium curvatum]TPX16434.1 hypothetical protein E0L32_003728 [Thyridium curvatum]
MTRVLRIRNGQALGSFRKRPDGTDDISHWELPAAAGPADSADVANLEEAARHLRQTDVPVGFPTETVYGLGADATRSAAVKGIYAAKGRPSDNPLIVHVCDLEMLADVMRGFRRAGDDDGDAVTAVGANGASSGLTQRAPIDLLPAIYRPLVERFWPGPLTLILPNPRPSRLAPEVTAGLATFGARMPASPLARSLIKLAGAPLAAPSANASTKPSPTAAQHVLDDLDGRIGVVLDGGPCSVGVESTVVDGLCDPPVVLRPGGVSLEELRACPGWEGVEKAYRDRAEDGNAGSSAPRAPGMKYKHYSPKARVVLYEASVRPRLVAGDVREAAEKGADDDGDRLAVSPRIGIVRTGRWPEAAGASGVQLEAKQRISEDVAAEVATGTSEETPALSYVIREGALSDAKGRQVAEVLDVDLGSDTRGIAHGLFSVLRELDRREVDVIFVEGIRDRDDIAAAVMNRLRKAASQIIR